MERLTHYYNGSVAEPYNRTEAFNMAKKLADYEDAEENGLLVKLPCEVGNTVYIADNWKNEVSEFKVNKIGIFTGRKVFCYQKDFEQPITPDLWGKTVFFTCEEAEKALKERK